MAGSDGRDIARGKLPEELWLGISTGQWPVQTFINEGHLMTWLSEKTGETQSYPRRAWKVRIEIIEEVELVRPAPFLRTKGRPDGLEK